MKKQVREKFRNAVFTRDGGKCVFCNAQAVDAHHITDRNEIVNGGYVKENGISLCAEHHILAEKYHETGVSAEGFSPEDLYKKIKSSKELAIKMSEKL
jgi:hypothetical protein